MPWFKGLGLGFRELYWGYIWRMENKMDGNYYLGCRGCMIASPQKSSKELQSHVVVFLNKGKRI